ncbi:hypothetical protein QN277_029204 [Acacia crassicarpa]|uniref:Protein kinase domain-containing protein n=1 Tax=Acacia crassicarpa TaxID=499986 RepID=A0AAE1K2E2_9FABA|nr:hypothetical protein QN277_029204 [Acacia crassicarpa]
MASIYYVFRFLLFFHFVIALLSAGYGNGKLYDKCPKSFDCGNLGRLRFPFTKPELPHCGFFAVRGCGDDPSSNKTIQLDKNGKPLLLKRVQQQHNKSITVFVEDHDEHLKSTTCEVYNHNIAHRSTPNHPPLLPFNIKPNLILFTCTNEPHLMTPDSCPDYHDYYCDQSQSHTHPPNMAQSSLSRCSTLRLPCRDMNYTEDLGFSCVKIDIEVESSVDCYNCNHKGGLCLVDDHNNFSCGIEKDNRLLKLGFGLGLGGLMIVVIGCLIIIWRQRKQHNKLKYASSSVQLQSTNNGGIVRSSNTDLESGMAYFGIPVFSYEELEKATNNFDHSREIGSGGFGTVYYGELGDGREVAVKRLYDHNYRGIEQFMNEVNIQTRLRHRNLVSLYGCTSRHCRELLLVYEYIPNGTLSCHLDVELAHPCLLPWPIRMKIAIETASALAYLHASDTIHRDVKTNNILLDINFCVKVADFGLSRLFPNDVTHVSTAPQGTPVDFRRNKDEINLANLAINKIQKSALGELVDPFLGFETDSEVRRMIVSVAELAFQCLQRDKDLRPSMDEVLEILKRIESGKEEQNGVEEVDINGVNVISYSGPISPPSPDPDEAISLKVTESLTPAPATKTRHT